MSVEVLDPAAQESSLSEAGEIVVAADRTQEGVRRHGTGYVVTYHLKPRLAVGDRVLVEDEPPLGLDVLVQKGVGGVVIPEVVISVAGSEADRSSHHVLQRLGSSAGRSRVSDGRSPGTTGTP